MSDSDSDSDSLLNTDLSTKRKINTKEETYKIIRYDTDTFDIVENERQTTIINCLTDIIPNTVIIIIRSYDESRLLKLEMLKNLAELKMYRAEVSFYDEDSDIGKMEHEYQYHMKKYELSSLLINMNNFADSLHKYESGKYRNKIGIEYEIKIGFRIILQNLKMNVIECVKKLYLEY